MREAKLSLQESLLIPPILKDFALTLATGAFAQRAGGISRQRWVALSLSIPPVPKDFAHHLPTDAFAQRAGGISRVRLLKQNRSPFSKITRKVSLPVELLIGIIINQISP